MKFQNIDDIKAFLEWAKAQKIQKVKVGEVEVEFSILALTDEDQASIFTPPKTEAQELQAKLEEQKEDDEIVFWSARS